MNTDVRLHCSNCGMDFAPPSLPKGEAEPSSYACPVCQFQVAISAPAADAPVSLDDLQAQLDALLAHARSVGIPVNDITRLLRDELEFFAELEHGGRRFMVQIIDLGPQSIDGGDSLVANSRDLLQRRGQSLDRSN